MEAIGRKYLQKIGHVYLILPVLLVPWMMLDSCPTYARRYIIPGLMLFKRRFNPQLFDGGTMDCVTLDFVRMCGNFVYDEVYYKRMRNSWKPEKQLAEAALCNGCFKVLPPEYVFRWPERCFPYDNPPEIFFLIKTAPGNFERRKAVRDTWLRNPITASQQNRFRYAFLSGLSQEILGDAHFMRKVSSIKTRCEKLDCSNHKDVEFDRYRRNYELFVESSIDIETSVELAELQLGEALLHGDVILSDNFGDSYANLTNKLLSGLQWTRTFCPKARFVVPVDDDTFVFVDRLLKLLERYKTRPLFMGGNRMYGEPNRQNGSKWYISPEKYAPDRTPDYFNGPIVVAGNDSVHALLKVMPNLRVDDLGVQLDDFIVTGFARALAGIEEDHICHFSIGDHSWRRMRHHEIEPWVVAVLSNPINNFHLHRAILANSRGIENLDLTIPYKIYA